MASERQTCSGGLGPARGRGASCTPLSRYQREARQTRAPQVDVLLVRRAPTREPDYFRTPTARAMIINATTSEIADCTSMSVFAHRVSGRVSVGLNAVAVVKARYR